jgi:hypothetical protein
VTPTRFARPSSNHPEVVLASFVGGNVKAVYENIEYSVYQRLMTPDGAHCVDTRGINGDAIDYYRALPPLSDSDY